MERVVEVTPSAPPAPVAAAESPDSASEPPVLRERGAYHDVLPGQTLWRIAKTYAVPVDELARANGLEDPSRLEAGTRIFVPGAERPLSVPPAELGSAELGSVELGSVELQGHSFVWPVTGGTVVSYFGAPRKGRRHQGLDIRGRHGQPIRAIAAGEVVYSGSGMRGFGKTVVLDHGEGLRSLYAHGSRLLVRVGQQVEQGATIALVGHSGNATADHCHLEIRDQDVPVDPLRILRNVRADGERR